MTPTSMPAPPASASLLNPNRMLTVLVCGATGLLGGLALMPAAHATMVTGPVLGVLYGVLFALLFSKRASGAGSGLLWSLSYALLLWLAVVTVILQLVDAGVTSLDQLRTNRDNFPDLVGYMLCFGAPLGLVLGTLQSRRPQNELTPFSAGRAIMGGTLAGIVGGWAFGKWMEQVNFYPLIAGLVGSNSRMVGESLHFIFAVIIGISFGLLFQREARGYGSSMACGVAYGIFWWFLGPLTILPLWSRQPVDWSSSHASSLFGSLIGHIVYGVIVGLVYAVVDRLWVKFFTESDPIRRQPEGPGVRFIRLMQWGAVSGVAGGTLYALVLVVTGSWKEIAAIAGGTSATLGFFIHLVISVLMGASYGLLFQREAPNRPSGRQRAAFEHFAQILPFDELHDEVRRAGRSAPVGVNRNHIGVTHFPESGHLLLEPPLNPGFLFDLATEHLDGATLLPLAIISFHHVGKTAARDKLANFKARGQESRTILVPPATALPDATLPDWAGVPPSRPCAAGSTDNQCLPAWRW
jgi:hypothetical protein